MIYSSSLQNTFNTLALTDFTEALETHLTNTFLQPNDLNVNPISLSYIRSNKTILDLLYKNIKPEDISSNLDLLFLTIFNKGIEEIRKEIILISKTKFLQLILSTFIYGLLKELENYETVKAANNPFNL